MSFHFDQYDIFFFIFAVVVVFIVWNIKNKAKNNENGVVRSVNLNKQRSKNGVFESTDKPGNDPNGFGV